MTRTRTMVAAGAAVVLALGAGVILALGGAADRTGADALPVVLGTDLATTSTTPTTSSGDPTAPSAPTSSSSSVPSAPSAPSATDGTAPAGGMLSAEQAAQVALARVGGGTVTKVEQEYEHGRPEWKFEIAHAGTTWEVRVDAGTGTITRFRDDDGGGHGGDDDSGRHGGDDSGDDGGDDSGGDSGDDSGGDRGRGGHGGDGY
ncbi:MAG TPA: PepSY domain-containing protein [Pseudonocardiaceae bacterium]